MGKSQEQLNKAVQMSQEQLNIVQTQIQELTLEFESDIDVYKGKCQLVSKENKVLKNKMTDFESETKILKEITSQQNEYISTLEIEVENLKSSKVESQLILDGKEVELAKTKDMLEIKTKNAES